jgi:sulfur relay (sulfurtransferase) complex TusBCD TusD component (DsrE family)
VSRWLGIVVATPPVRGDFERAERLARAARAAGHEVSLFLMADATIWGTDPRASALVDEGCAVVVCATNLGERAAAAGVEVGSQDDHAAIARRADRLVAFT